MNKNLFIEAINSLCKISNKDIVLGVVIKLNK